MMTSNWKTWLQLILGLSLAFLFSYMMAPFAVPILLGAICAIVCYPFYYKLRQKVPATLAALGVTIALTLGILLPILFVLYSGSYKVLKLVSNLKILKDGDTLENFVTQPWMRRLLTLIGSYAPMESGWWRERVIELVQNIAEKTYSFVAAGIAQMPGILLGLAVLILSVYFMLRDGERLLHFLAGLSPMSREKSLDLYRVFEKSCRAVVIGLFLSAFVQGVLMCIFALITSVPNPVLLGAITAGMGMVPLVGSAPIWIGAVIYLFVKAHVGLAIIMLIGGALISISDNVVRTLIMQGGVQMHPLLALVSVFGALALVGPPGIFLGPIVAAIFVSFLQMVSQSISED
ncbi:MAG: AI-2E family transporter [Deltaproteobacteria bacterium]|nr:AI-2E family transporter [Deltaproteobacteria bacterium]